MIEIHLVSTHGLFYSNLFVQVYIQAGKETDMIGKNQKILWCPHAMLLFYINGFGNGQMVQAMTVVDDEHSCMVRDGHGNEMH